MFKPCLEWCKKTKNPAVAPANIADQWSIFLEVLSKPKERIDSPQNKMVPSPNRGVPKWCTVGFFTHKVLINESNAKPVKMSVCFEKNNSFFAASKTIKHEPIRKNTMWAATRGHSESTQIPILNGGSAATNSQKLIAIAIDKKFSNIFLNFVFFMTAPF